MESTTWLLPVLGILVLVAVLVSTGKMKAQRETWQELALLTKLNYEAGSFLRPVRVTGIFNGRGLVLDTEARRGYKRWIYYTRIRNSLLNAKSFHLELNETNTINKLGNAISKSGFQTGFSGIDKRFSITTNNKELAIKLLSNPNLQAHLLNEEKISLKIDGDEIHFTQFGINTSVKKLQTQFEYLQTIARLIEADNRQPNENIDLLPLAEQFVKQRELSKGKIASGTIVILIISLIALAPYLCIFSIHWFFSK